MTAPVGCEDPRRLRLFMAKLLSRLQEMFVAHPASVGESYGYHARFAGLTGLRMVLAGFACVIHAAFPFLFVRTASECIRDLHDGLSARQRRARDAASRGVPGTTS
jgi:hypothetical protein